MKRALRRCCIWICHGCGYARKAEQLGEACPQCGRYVVQTTDPDRFGVPTVVDARLIDPRGHALGGLIASADRPWSCPVYESHSNEAALIIGVCLAAGLAADALLVALR